MMVAEVKNAVYEADLYINCSGNLSVSTWAVTPDYDVGRNVIIATNQFKLVGKPSEGLNRQKLLEPAPAG